MTTWVEELQDGPGSPSAIFQVQRREEDFQELLLKLFVLMKVSEDPAATGTLEEEALDAFFEILIPIVQREGELSVVEKGGHLFLNGVRARLRVEGFSALKFLVQTLFEHDLSGIRFLMEVEREEVDRFRSLLFESREEQKDMDFAEVLQKNGIVSIQSIPRRHQGPCDHMQPGIRPDQTYLRTIFVQKQLLEGLDVPDFLDIRRAKQVLELLLGHLLKEERCLVALDSLRTKGEELFRHSVHVAVYSLFLGRKLGLPSDLLGQLGVSALFHDLGLVLRGDPAPHGEPSETGLETFHALIQLGTRSDLLRRAALTAWDSQRDEQEGNDFDSLGGGPGLFGRIIALADAMDTLLTQEAGQESPSELERMIRALQKDHLAEEFSLLDLFGGRLRVDAQEEVKSGNHFREEAPRSQEPSSP